MFHDLFQTLFHSRTRLALCLFAAPALFHALRAEPFDWSDANELHPGILHVSMTVSEPRLMVVNAVRVDLTEPAVRFKTTGRHPNWGVPMQPPLFVSFEQDYFIRTGRQRTRDFLNQNRDTGLEMVLAINAAPWRPFSELGWSAGSYPYADRLGLTVADGILVDDGNNRPSLVLNQNWDARMQDSPAGTSLDGIQIAVSGFQFVLRDGTPEGSTGSAEPRTGYGLCQDSRYLFLITIDGRQAGYSLGATHREVGAWLLYFGSHIGVNMDGGGSTTLVWWDPDSTLTDKSVLLNQPSDSPPRSVGNNLGIYLDTRPAAVGLASNALNTVVPRNREETLAFDIYNDGGNVLAYTLSSDADWVVVPNEALSVKGRRTQDITLNTHGMSAGIHEATVTIVNAEDPSDTQTLSISLEVTPEPEDLPIVQTFEDLDSDTVLPGIGGWRGESWTGQVITEDYTPALPPGYPVPEAAHTRVARFRSGLSHGVNSAEQEAVTVDLMLRVLPGPLRDAERMPPETQAAFAVDGNGLLHIWHGHFDGEALTPRWTPMGHAALQENEWVRVSVDLDYSTNPAGHSFFRPRINGSLVPTEHGRRAPDDPTSPGPWYLTANSPGADGSGQRRLAALAFEGTGALDDLVIRSTAQALDLYSDTLGFAHSGELTAGDVPLHWFDRWGLRRDPGAESAVPGRTVADAYWTGTDPRDPEQVFRATGMGLSAGILHLEINGNDSGSSIPFRLMRSLDLRENAWEHVGDIPRAPAPASTVAEIEIGEEDPPQFFRVEALRGPPASP